MSRLIRFGFRPTARRSMRLGRAISCACCEPMVPRSQRSACPQAPRGSSCRPRPRLLTLRPRNQLAPAVRADTIHSGRAVGTEGAFKAADPGLVGGWQARPALFTRRTHLERHSSCPKALRPAESTTGALVGLFARGIDASGVVLVALAAALRHLRRSLRIAEALRGADVARAPLVDSRQDYLPRFAYVRAPHIAHILAARTEGPRPPVPLPIQPDGDV